MKSDNPEMFLRHCDIHTQNLVFKNTSPFNEVIRPFIKCINFIKARMVCDPLLKQFCESTNVGHVRLFSSHWDSASQREITWSVICAFSYYLYILPIIF